MAHDVAPLRPSANAGRRDPEEGEAPLWIPTWFNEAFPPAGSFGWNAIGRLKVGISADDASTQRAPLVQHALQELIRADNYRAFLTDGGYRLRVNDMKEDTMKVVIRH